MMSADQLDVIPLISLLDPEVVDSPVGFYHQLLSDAPVWRVPDRALVVVSAFDAISEVVKRPEDFSSNIRSLVFRDENGLPGLTPFGSDVDGIDVLATADPPMHTAHRSMLFPELVARRMVELRPAVEELATSLIARAIEEPAFDFMRSTQGVRGRSRPVCCHRIWDVGCGKGGCR